MHTEWVGRSQEKKLLRRSRYKWKDNTDTDRKGKGYKVVDPIHLAGYMKQYSVLEDTHRPTSRSSFEVLVAIQLRIPLVLDMKLRELVNG